MNDKNLLASAALFSALYNNEDYTNIFDIIAEFIKGAIIHENKFSFTSTEITNLLENIYEFQIPESVVRTTLNNKLKNEVERKEGYYYFKSAEIKELKNINEEYDLIAQNQNQIFIDLIEFVSNREQSTLKDSDKKELFENFTQFLLDNGYSERFSNLISAYIIKNEKNAEFTNSLNIIREGIILYQGIKFTADINELGKWTNDITLYLNTEHLFNALGYNGILFQEIFNDFIGLVNEINNSNPKSERNKVELRFFEETKREVDHFFLTAESIFKGYKKLDPTRPAMKLILEGCKSLSDIKAKRIKFDLDLKHKGIKLQDFNVELSKLLRYNVEDRKSLDELQKLSQQNGRIFDEDLCMQYFRIFTKINYYRKGESAKPFERIGHLFITENGFAKYLAHNNLVKFEDNDISFAKDIDFIITKFWFKLKKGFSSKHSLPKSFDVVTKARIILSSHINNSVSEEYRKLVNQTNAGTLSQEEALQRSYEFREKPVRPEDVTIENVDDSLDFLTNESYFENLHREKEKKDALLTDTQKQNEQLIAELRRRDEIENQKIKKNAQIDYVNSTWKSVTNKNWRNFGLFFTVILLNFLLAIFAVFVSIDSNLKNWLIKFNFYQDLLISIYIIIIVVEVIGRSYIFNKDRLKSGWEWLLIIIYPPRFLQTRRKLKFKFEQDFLVQYES